MPQNLLHPTSPIRPCLAGIMLALAGAAFFATKGIVIKLALMRGHRFDDDADLADDRRRADLCDHRDPRLSPQARSATAGAPPLLDRRTLLQTLGVGVLGYYVASYLDFAALEYITAQFDRLILLTYPFFVVLFGAMFFSRRVTGTMMAGAAGLSYVGIALIFWHDFAHRGRQRAARRGAGLRLGRGLCRLPDHGQAADRPARARNSSPRSP